MIKHTTQAEREHYWRKVILDWQSSGEQINDYCKKHKVTLSGFYNWRKKLFPELKIRRSQSGKKQEPAIRPVEIIHESIKRQPIKLHLPNGCWLSLERDFDVALIKQLISTLGGDYAHATRC